MVIFVGFPSSGKNLLATFKAIAVRKASSLGHMGPMPVIATSTRPGLSMSAQHVQGSGCGTIGLAKSIMSAFYIISTAQIVRQKISPRMTSRIRQPMFRVRSLPALPRTPRQIGWPQCGHRSAWELTLVWHVGQATRLGLLALVLARQARLATRSPTRKMPKSVPPVM